jgi:hypothetical protein
VHHATERAAPENWGKPSEQPWKVDAKSREQREKEKERHHPMQETGVDPVPQQFARKNLSAPDGFKSLPRFLVKALNRGSH